jgi:hypothetical protein
LTLTQENATPLDLVLSWRLGQASVRDGTVPIFLFDGQEIAQIMIDKGLGVTRRPIEVYEDRVESLFEKE